MLRVYNINISASKKASDLPFYACHFKILRNLPKHSSNPTYSDWLLDQGFIDTIDRGKKENLYSTRDHQTSKKNMLHLLEGSL